jgi:hypothetical protein
MPGETSPFLLQSHHFYTAAIVRLQYGTIMTLCRVPSESTFYVKANAVRTPIAAKPMESSKPELIRCTVV